MMLQELHRYYQRKSAEENSEMPPYGTSVEKNGIQYFNYYNDTAKPILAYYAPSWATDADIEAWKANDPNGQKKNTIITKTVATAEEGGIGPSTRVRASWTERRSMDIGVPCIKKFDDAFQEKIKAGFEMLVNNFSSGLIGFALAIVGYYAIGPVVGSLTNLMAAGVESIINMHLLPLANIFQSMKNLNIAPYMKQVPALRGPKTLLLQKAHRVQSFAHSPLH